MKRMYKTLAACILFVFFTSCSDSANSSATNDTSSMKADDSNSGAMNGQQPNSNNSSTGNEQDNANNSAQQPPVSIKPLSMQDSTFAIKAAEGGMMEVESSNAALQNSTNERVKMFATMMVNDHSKANSELMTLASSRGLKLPSSLPAEKQKHIDAMKKMQGKTFDKHYLDMMMTDHKKTIADFEKQTSSGADEELKTWAGKTLPALKMHRDSVIALSKIKMQ